MTVRTALLLAFALLHASGREMVALTSGTAGSSTVTIRNGVGIVTP